MRQPQPPEGPWSTGSPGRTSQLELGDRTRTRTAVTSGSPRFSLGDSQGPQEMPGGCVGGCGPLWGLRSRGEERSGQRAGLFPGAWPGLAATCGAGAAGCKGAVARPSCGWVGLGDSCRAAVTNSRTWEVGVSGASGKVAG